MTFIRLERYTPNTAECQSTFYYEFMKFMSSRCLTINSLTYLWLGFNSSAAAAWPECLDLVGFIMFQCHTAELECVKMKFSYSSTACQPWLESREEKQKQQLHTCGSIPSPLTRFQTLANHFHSPFEHTTVEHTSHVYESCKSSKMWTRAFGFFLQSRCWLCCCDQIRSTLAISLSPMAHGETGTNANWNSLMRWIYGVWFCIIYSARVDVINYERTARGKKERAIEWGCEKLDLRRVADF